MFIKVEENKLINRSSIQEVVRYDDCVYFMNNNRRAIASRKFNSIEEAQDYCEELSLDSIAEVIGVMAEKVENIGYGIQDLLEEMKRIGQVMGK